MAEGASITQLLASWSQGDRMALEALAPQVHQELLRLAKSYLHRERPSQTLQPTALVNEAWLRLVGQSHPPQYENRSHFFGIAARSMRMILVDYARAHDAKKRGGGDLQIITVNEAHLVSRNRAPDLLELNEALEQLAAIDERKASVVELRYFGGMEREEIATALNLTLHTVKRDLRLAEAWLRQFLA